METTTRSAAVLLSGGLDSATCLALARADLAYNDLHAVSIRYGQRHETELDAARRVAQFYGATWHVIDAPMQAGGSLTGDTPMPHMTYEELAASEGPSPTYVPFRNAALLSIATGVAMVNDCEVLYAGMHAEDAHNFAYPDCTPEFLGAMANAIHVGTYYAVRLITPLQWLSKAEVVALGFDLQVPFHLTLSCYEGTDPACGRCPTCIGRLEAFRVNDLVDPLPYAVPA